jgi:hypothetical protein
MLPYVLFENGKFFISYSTDEFDIREDVTEFIQQVLTISALNVLEIENQHPQVIVQISDDRQPALFDLDNVFFSI